MLDSIRESFEKQATEQGETIYSRESKYYLSSLHWNLTVEGVLFWRILNVSHSIYGVYDYETLIKLHIRFNTVPHIYVYTHFIYIDYFDEVKGTLTSEGFEKLIKQIEKC